jgi:hypothetical protein
MKYTWIAVLGCLLAVGCASEVAEPNVGPNGSAGGTTNTGGAAGQGGSSQAGGSSNTGGASNTQGGAGGTAGVSNTGGTGPTIDGCPPSGTVGLAKGNIPPEVVLQDCEGNPVSIYNMCGKQAAYVYTFANWCPNCKDFANGKANAFYEKYHPLGMEMYFVITSMSHTQDYPDKADCAAVKKQFGLVMPVLFDPDGLTKSKLNMELNTADLVMKQGNIIVVEPNQWALAAPVEPSIRQLLGLNPYPLAYKAGFHCSDSKCSMWAFISGKSGSDGPYLPPGWIQRMIPLRSRRKLTLVHFRSWPSNQYDFNVFHWSSIATGKVNPKWRTYFCTSASLHGVLRLW